MSFRSVTLRHLRLVSVLGKELNITRSAELLHSTQPALSRTLAEASRDYAEFNAAGLAEKLFGDAIYANMMLVGAALLLALTLTLLFRARQARLQV